MGTHGRAGPSGGFDRSRRCYKRARFAPRCWGSKSSLPPALDAVVVKCDTALLSPILLAPRVNRERSQQRQQTPSITQRKKHHDPPSSTHPSSPPARACTRLLYSREQ